MGLFCFSRSPTIVPARKVYQSRQDAEFKVDVDIKCCIHGYLAKDKKQPASLIIFAPQLICVENDAFNLFRLEVDFGDRDDSGQPCEPTIVSTAPYTVEEHLYEEIVEHKNKIENSSKRFKKIEANAGAAQVPFKADLRGELGFERQKIHEVEYTTKVHYFHKGSSNTRVDDESGRRYSAWWNVKKGTNPKAGDDAGIPTNYLFAVLLTRTNDSTPFNAHFRLFAEAGWAHRREKMVEIVSRHLTTKGRKKARPSSAHRPLLEALTDFAAGKHDGCLEPMTFDPRIAFEGDCQGIDRMRLGKYKRDDKLVKLTMRSKP